MTCFSETFITERVVFCSNIVISMFDIPVCQHITNMYRKDIPLSKWHAVFYNYADTVFCLLCNKSCQIWSWIFGTSHLWPWCYCLAFLLLFRSSFLEVFCKKGVFRNFAKFTGKHLCQSLFFNKVAGWPATFLKKRFWHRCFPVNFAKFLKTHHFYRTPPGGCFCVITFTG